MAAIQQQTQFQPQQTQSTDTSSKFWIDAWYDPLSASPALQSCICLADINGDGDHKLLIGISNANPLSKTNLTSNNNSNMSSHSQTSAHNRLKVLKGTTVVSENILLEEPVAICSFYPDYKTPRKPIVAVACGGFVFLYKNLQPFFKFIIPAQPQVPAQHVTCMSVLHKDKPDDDAIGMLVIGTESKHVYILDSFGSSVKKQIQIPAAPVFLATSGQFDVEYRVFVACRNGNVYAITNGELSGIVFELEANPCALCVLDKNVAVATMQNCVQVYVPKVCNLMFLNCILT